MYLLLVEDDLNLGNALRKLLRTQFNVDWVRNLSSARSQFAAAAYDVVLLDLGLPDGDGVQWLETLRSEGCQTPVLIVSARDRLDDRVRGLDTGADDYLVKPFEPEELLARVRALLRRSAGTAQPRFVVGALSYAPDTQQFCLDNRPLSLSPQERSILAVLVQAGEKPVSRERLLQQLYGLGDGVDSNTQARAAPADRQGSHRDRARHRLSAGGVVSIRLSHVAALLALAMVVTAAIGVVATYREAGDELRDVLDDDLENQGRLVARLLAAEHAGLPADSLGALLRKTFRPDEQDSLWVNVYDLAAGRFASNLAHDLPLADTRNGRLRLQFGGHDWEGWQRREGDLVVQLLRRSDQYEELGREILDDITLPVLIGSVVNLALLAALIGLSLWPIARLAREIESRNADSLAPLVLRTHAAEIAVLRDTLNSMMAGVDTALQRERQFANDVAHELRTPFTTLKLELADEAPDRTAMRSEVDRLARLVEQLLTLARLDQSRWQAGFGPVDLQALYAPEIEHFTARMEQAGITLHSDLAALTIDGEATLLQVLLQNLLKNILAHCPSGTHALVRLHSASGHPVLEVSDTGPGIAEPQRRQMGQGSRHLDSRSGGLGIGLTICHRIAQVHGASLEFLAREDETQGLRVRVTFAK